MPRGRFLNKEICIDRKVNELSCYESMLAFTWIIPHLDCNGLTYGDPAVVRSMVFPRRNDITLEQMESYINEWQEKGLINIYTKGDEKYIWFPNFAKHQIGLKKEREAKSGIPLPDNFPTEPDKNQDNIPQVSGIGTESIGNNLNVNLNANSNVNLNANSNDDDDANSVISFPSVWKEYTQKVTTDADWQPLMAIHAIPGDLKTALDELMASGRKLPRSPDRCVESVGYVVKKRAAKCDDDDYRKYIRGKYAAVVQH